VCLSPDGRKLFTAGGEVWNPESARWESTGDHAIYQWSLPEEP
jgi:hypothetical protein